jgi:hypothetical protein
VRRLYTFTHVLRQFRKKLANDIVRCEAVGIFGFEVRLANDSIFVNLEEPRVRHPFGHSLRFRIQHVETTNDLGIRVGQQRKLDMVAVGEVHEDR